MKKIEEIKSQVLKEIKPAESEIKAAKDKFDEIRQFIAQEYDKQSVLMGSVAKDTFLQGDKDLDIFVFFPPAVARDQLEEKGLEIGKSVFDRFDGDYVVEYAEHPYTKGQINGFDVEIVPCCRVESGAELNSAVDRTPFHTQWVNEQLTSKEKDEVIILKKFLKGLNLYGSSLKVRGFSGYLCELLIHKYSSFEDLVEAAPDWNHKEKIDAASHWQKEEDIVIPDELWKKFKEDALIVIDPVDPNRNVASVLSHENYAEFIYRCWEFLRQPSLDYFRTEEASEADLELIKNKIEQRGQMLTINCDRPSDVVDDVLYPQLRKAVRRIEQLLEEHEFELFDRGLFIDEDRGKMKLLFDLKVWSLPPASKRQGPRVYHNSKHLKEFTDKYEDVWVEGDRLVTIIEREYQDCERLLMSFLSEKDLEEKGIPSHLAPVLQEAEIKTVRPQEIEDNKEWLSFLNRFLRLKGGLKSGEKV